MRPYPIEKTRNIGIIAHIDAGKTTISERVLFYTGVSHKIGEVHEGTTVMDWMPQERERGITITAAATTCFWRRSYLENEAEKKASEHRINIIDTPGHIDFTAEVERSLRVLDGAVVVFDGVQGVEPQSETVWRQADKYRVARLCFINKIDRLGASFAMSLESIRERLSEDATAVIYPVGSQDEFSGVVDLIRMKYFEFEGEHGDQILEKPIPEKAKEAVERYRHELLEKIGSRDETFLEKYLSGSFTESDIRSAIRRLTLDYRFIPVYSGSALKNKGVQFVLDGVLDYLPAPTDMRPVIGIDPKTKEPLERKHDDDSPFSGLVFKIAVDPYVGTLDYVRVYSGTLKKGDTILNVNDSIKTRIGRIVRMHANHREDAEELFAGDIGAIVGLKDVRTGYTLSSVDAPVLLEEIKFAEPVITMHIEPKTKTDQEKMGVALRALMNEDPTFVVSTDQETFETLISGMGELHLDIMVDRLRREFNIQVNVGTPQVAYKEAITASAEAEGKYIRQSGGRGQYGHVVVRAEPTERGSGIEFVDAIKGGAIPASFIPAVEKGIREAAEKGVIAGYPVRDVRITLTDGSFHEVDSSEFAFKIAGSIAFQEVVRRASPVILEPIMKVQVVVQNEFLGTISGDLNSRRGRIENVSERANAKVIDAYVPLKEMFGYATGIRSLTQGRGVFTMEFSNYQELPRHLAAALMPNKE